ncbi:MAG: hypothetical protein H0Z55_04000, partial [Nitrosarchaeum sp.]|nr:hypothetical protein [Nitrosarchaeum sp.]
PELNASFSSDPFTGITDNDIFNYSELYEIPPPENDDQAIKLGIKIRQWIKQGRPKPSESKINNNTNNEFEEDSSKTEEIIDKKHKQDKEEEKFKKNRGVFGFFKK